MNFGGWEWGRAAVFGTYFASPTFARGGKLKVVYD